MNELLQIAGNQKKTNTFKIKPTSHLVYFADSRKILEELVSETVQLVVTSPPYWCARDYEHEHQIGYNQTFEEYNESLMKIWKESVRALLPDGKIAVNIGNIYYNKDGEKRKIVANLMNLVWSQLNSFDDLRYMGTIHWEKSTSRKRKVLMGSYPYPSAFLISTALEAIFVFRKVGYRKVALEIKELSKISKREFRSLRSPIWRINGVSNEHPAPFPPELPRRLIKMYSFVGGKILDPFLGSGTTLIQAAKLNRSSIGVEVNERYSKILKEQILKNQKALRHCEIKFYNARKLPVFRFGMDNVRNGEMLSIGKD
jgi:DNA modification methylase